MTSAIVPGHADSAVLPLSGPCHCIPFHGRAIMILDRSCLKGSHDVVVD